ncbi:MAG TPA: translocation/assembly module TamB domain-containing protein, partial [Polyangiaceae bacterium]|nr:translocation/assembly module TamB domain-containing protein [Polyangiaceae bacterium]
PALAGAAQTLSEQVTHELDYRDGHIETTLRLQDSEGAWLTLQAQADPLPGRTRAASISELLEHAQLPVTELLQNAAWDVEVAAQPRDLARWSLPTSLTYLGESKLAANLSMHGQPQREPRGKLTFDVSGLPSSGDSTTCMTRNWRMGGQLDFEDGDFRAAVSGYHGQDQLLQLNTGGHFALLPRLRGETPPAPKLEVVAKIERLPLAGVPVVCTLARGTLTSTLRVQDPFGKAPRATVDLGVLGFSLGSEQSLDLKARVAVDPQQLVANGSLTAEGKASSFELNMALPAPGSGSALAADAAIEGKLALQALPLAAVVPREGPLSHVSGTASGSVQLQGSVGAPRFSGKLEIQQAGFTATALAQPLSDIDGEISFADDVILLKQLSARDGDGTLAIDGRLKIESADEFDGTFNLSAQKFPLRRSGQVLATTTTNAQIQALWSPTVRDLRLQLRDFDTWLEGVQAASGLALEAHPDVVVDDPATKAALAGAGNGDSAATKLILRIDAGQQFWVRRADFAIKLSANLEIVVDEKSANAAEAAVSVTGQLQFDRGYLELLGRVFDIERGGSLRFTGGLDAIIDLNASYLDRRSEKTVKVQISGSATSPQLEFFLEGTRITPAEAFTAIYGTETSSPDEIEDTEAQAKQFVSALTAGMIATTLRRNLGAMAPIVMVTPGDSQSGGQLRAGFEADSLIPDFMRGVVTGVYLEGILSQDNTTANGSGQRDVQRGVSIDVHFPHNLVTSGRYGPDTTWSLDFGWQP